MLNYKAIEIFTDEEARFHNKPLADAVIDHIRHLKIAARCIVTKGIAGCDESGELCTERLEVLSHNLPIRIYVILPAAVVETVLAEIDAMIESGIVVLHDLPVVSHKAASTFFPRQLKVRDVMTAKPRKVTAATLVSEAARQLLSSIFTGLPVVDREERPIGVVTQGDLIVRGGMPLRLGLLDQSGREGVEAVMEQLARRRVEEIMSAPPVVIDEDRPLGEAVDLMLGKNLKRLPVIDGAGRLSGMLSRLDIFRTVMREAPDWQAFQAQHISVQHLRTVADIVRRDTRTVTPETTIDQVIRIIDGNDIQMVAVVDDSGRLLGVISDHDLLRYFKPDKTSWQNLFARIAHSLSSTSPGELGQRLTGTTAKEVMSEAVTIGEEALIEEAIRLMTEKRLKRLPVIDSRHRFQGMISRDSLLRTGFRRN